MAQNQGSPSLSGSSVEFYNSGVWANALWWNKLDANDSVSNFLWDFYFYLDDASLSSAQALEFDVFQASGGYNYMIGLECNYPPGVWDTWDEASGQWIHSSVPCPQFAPNTWHHFQSYVQRLPNTQTYKYVTLAVDGNSYTVNVTGNAKYLAWSDELGVQYQLDVNASGAGYHMWVDNSNLTVW
jgi:hypothetical protein